MFLQHCLSAANSLHLPLMKRIKLTLAYEGTEFSGWQVQPELHGKVPRTVQGELESALLSLTGLSIRVHGAGRTDAGVHAERQVAHFDAPDDMHINWQRALHAKLPPDIAIRSAEAVPDNFHARYSSCGKEYVYTLWTESGYLLPRLRRYAWACGKVDWSRLEQAAKMLEGEHDFAAVQNAGAKPGDTKRRLYHIKRKVGPYPEAKGAVCSPCMELHFYGNGFLKQMVRNLAGFLVWVGQGRLEVSAAEKLLASRRRDALDFPTAPAWGLTLLRVLYPQEPVGPEKE